MILITRLQKLNAVLVDMNTHSHYNRILAILVIHYRKHTNNTILKHSNLSEKLSQTNKILNYRR